MLNELALVAQEATDPEQAMTAALEVLAGADHELQGGALYSRPGATDEDQAAVPHGVFGDASDEILVPASSTNPTTR